MTNESEQSHKLATAAFGDALEAMSAVTPAPNAIDALISGFEEAGRFDDDDVEYWTARDMARLLEYADYRNFTSIVDKAKEACVNSGQAVDNHFVDVTEMVEIGSGALREIDDVKLTRYACYLIAQNGDPRKRPVAIAQTYFAVQARRQELQDEEKAQGLPLSEDERRVLLRNEIKEHNKNLASAAKGAGVIQPLDFAIFQTFGYKGLYGGLDRPAIQRRKGLRAKQALLDHVGSTELAANLFRATQTEEKLRRESIRGKDAANAVHFEVGRKVRKAIEDIGGVMPENLPAAEDIAKVERRLRKGIGSPPKKIS